MKICVVGLGYVGAVSAACLAEDGHSVIGVDTSASKVEMINSGNSPIVENGLDLLLKKGVENGLLSARVDVETAISETEMSMICVGTPSQLNGNLDLRFVRKVCEEIGSAIKKIDFFHCVVMRSTMLPGTMADVVLPILEESSGKKAGQEFGVCINPEFLREGTAIFDYNHPPKIVIGESDLRAGDVLASVYAHLDAPLVRTALHTAEMVKYSDNVWHALKVGFANEIGNICKNLSIDGREVMEIFCQDEKLNLSSYYMKPGFAFGGSCLPKDLRALNYKAKSLDLNVPIISSIMPSNRNQIETGLALITEIGSKKVGILGFSFKAGTDDLRESPLVEVIEQLIGKGYDLRLYDKNVNLAAIVGANRDYILNHIPHISKLMVEDVKQVLDHADILVIGNNADEFKEIIANAAVKHSVIDLSGIGRGIETQAKYQGICW